MMLYFTVETSCIGFTVVQINNKPDFNLNALNAKLK